MSVAMYDIYEQRKCFTGMKKKDAKFDILILRLAAALYSTVSYNKNMSFWPACLDRCGQIKKFSMLRQMNHLPLLFCKSVYLLSNM